MQEPPQKPFPVACFLLHRNPEPSAFRLQTIVIFVKHTNRMNVIPKFFSLIVHMLYIVVIVIVILFTPPLETTFKRGNSKTGRKLNS